MSKNILIKFDFISDGLEYIRERLGRTCLLIFISANWGHSLKAIKSSIMMLNFRQLDNYVPRSGGERDEMYQELYSVQTAEIFAQTIASALLALFIGLIVVHFVDRLEAPKALKSPDLRRLRRWTRREVKLLETQRRLIVSLEYEQALKDQGFKTIRVLEGIIQRYEQNSLAETSSISKRPKLSEKDKTIGDLFDEEPKLDARHKGRSRFVKFIRKF